MKDLKSELREKIAGLKAEIAAETDEAKREAKVRELNAMVAQFKAENALMEREKLTADCKPSKNAVLREYINDVSGRKMPGKFNLARENSQNVISSAVIQAGDTNNMTAAGLPVTVGDLINPLEMGLIYDKLGIKVATGVHGQLQWPCLANAVTATVGGELAEAGTKTLDFNKITATPYKVGIKISFSNEAINDAAFDLYGNIIAQINKSVGRLLNSRVLAINTPSTTAGFHGPLVGGNAQTATYSGDVPSYQELKAAKGQALATGADMASFCYVMDAAMYSALEGEPKDMGSGRFIIENGMIDGDPVFVTNLSDYDGKIVAGCFAYVACNQHGEVNFVIDPFTSADQNVTNFTLNADFSLTTLVGSGDTFPFVVISKGGSSN